MPYALKQRPASVYPDEMRDECPEAEVEIDVLLQSMAQHGPSPPGYAIKTLGAQLGGLWQANLKIEKRQVRILYAPYGTDIVLFRIHKKSSPREQRRAYTLAMKRKAEYEEAVRAIERRR